jgi:hypothetical protein
VSFRYTTSIEETAAKLTEAQKPRGHVDLIEFSEAMERLASYFDALDTFVSEIVGSYREMSAELYDSFY